MDQFARLLVNIFSHYNRTLPLIRELIEGEFKLVNEANKGAILRGNSMTSKIESAYSRILNQTVIICYASYIRPIYTHIMLILFL